MTRPSDDFMRKLLGDFYIEAAEHRQAIVAGLIALEQAAAPAQHALVEVCFREAHSLKGAARAVNQGDIERLCQAMESLFSALVHDKIALSPAILDLLHSAIDLLDPLLTPQTDGNGSRPSSELTRLAKSLEAAAKGDEQTAPAASRPARVATPAAVMEPPDEPEPPVVVPIPAQELDAAPVPIAATVTETVRISTARLNALLLQAEELIAARLIVAQHSAEMKGIQQSLVASRKSWEQLQAAQDDAQSADANPALREWYDDHQKPLEINVSGLTRRMEQDQRQVARMVDTLLEDTKKTLLFPFSSLLEIFPKLVRDLARTDGKEVALVIRGGETEIDRRILEEIKDPLIHMVRNCVDHGIELPDIRAQKNKPARGTLSISIAQKDSRSVEVVIADDGGGIDPQRVRKAAVRMGVIAAESAAHLTDTESLDLIFGSGISTSPIITDLSGRGVGMAIVREKVGKLGGTVGLETQLGVGTTFRLVLPLTLTGFRGVTVRVREQTFVVPTIHIERVLRARPENISTVQNRETLDVNGQPIALVELSEALGMPKEDAPDGGMRTALILSTQQRRIAFLVDALLGEQEVLVKGLGPQLQRVRNFSGATLLGNGKVVPILNVADLMDSALRLRRTAAPAHNGSAAEKTRSPRVLVAEDSITSRTLLKNILESAGYKVKTAVDGMEGLAMLRSNEFDLLVSDVEMPHMNGFELTEQVRGDQRLAELPVVLVTALQSQQDRARGMEVGANAYLVKSSFDQSDLLDVIRRLI